jgi:hypothetical protein
LRPEAEIIPTLTLFDEPIGVAPEQNENELRKHWPDEYYELLNNNAFYSIGWCSGILKRL